MVHVAILPQKRLLGRVPWAVTLWQARRGASRQRVPWVVVDFASEMKWSGDKIKGKNDLITELKPIATHPVSSHYTRKGSNNTYINGITDSGQLYVVCIWFREP